MDIREWLGEDNQLGIDIWHRKYQRNNETFDEFVERVSGGDEAVAELIRKKRFLFGGRILSNRGVNDESEKVTYSNCYVITPPEDNIESIYETCMKLAKTYSRGGGCGIDISKLAPRGAKVRNQAKTTSGAVSFMDTFAQVTDIIGQNGRRGALMMSIVDTHPDLEEFINIKNDVNKINSANISVRVSDKFMNAVVHDLEWELSFTREETGETISKVVRAKDIFHQMCENNWNYAEPGMLFWDNICGYNLLSNTPEFEYAGVNPCAEEPLPAGGSCLLGAINLAEYVEDGRFLYPAFTADIKTIVKAMNDVLDEGLMKHPLEEQQNSVGKWRQIGIGIMGLADMLIKMGLKYGSPEAVNLCDMVGHILASTAISASANLASTYGSYKGWNESVLNTSFFDTHYSDGLQAECEAWGLRNSQLLTVAPTGTISTLLGVSGGIEPIYANSYNRTTKSLHGEDVTYKIYTPIVKQYMEENNLTDESQLPDYFVTAKELDYKTRINMQAVWQKHIDASISSTINLPITATIKDVEDIYIQAWKQGLKGVTVYRDGCARGGILTEDSKPTEKEVEVPKAPSANDKTIGLESHLTTGCGSLHICAYFNEEGDLRNTYLSKGSTGGCNNYMIGLSRMMSLAARKGASIHEIVDQLGSCGTCPSYAVRRATKGDTSEGSSCPVAVGKALMKMWNEINDSKPIIPNQIEDVPKMGHPNKCPECGTEVMTVEGCVTCPHCGWSKCS